MGMAKSSDSAQTLQPHDTGGTAQRVGPLSFVCYPKLPGFMAFAGGMSGMPFSLEDGPVARFTNPCRQGSVSG